jgi:hypothetical protein
MSKVPMAVVPELLAQLTLKVAASSCVAVAAARRREVLSSFMYIFCYME